MKRKGFLILSIVILILIGATGIYFWTFRKADTSVSSKKADYELEASELLQRFEENEQLANEKYLGKILVVQGIINDITEDSLNISLHLDADNELSGIICSFNKAVINPQSVTIGDNVKVKGICTGYLLDVVMNRCSLVE